MKRVLFILIILPFLSNHSFAQTWRLEHGGYRTTVEMSYGGDTVIINDLSKVHFVRIGIKTYKIVTPEPYMEEVKPIITYGSFAPGVITFDSTLHIVPGSLYQLNNIRGL